MTHKQGQESQVSYMDGISVKISEQYKPPPRINLPISYAHRLSLNKLIQDNMPDYCFTLEENVKQQMESLRITRNQLAKRRQECEECVKEERKAREAAQQRDMELKKEESKQNINLSTSQATERLFSTTNNTQAYMTNNGILLPMQAPSYANVLEPTSLDSHNVRKTFDADRSPFNISDFEADTSSPFDNMELKTINDMEELAHVLKNEVPTYTSSNITNIYPSYSAYQDNLSQSYSKDGTYVQSNTVPKMSALSDSYSIPPITSYDPSIYSGMNGSYTSQLVRNPNATQPYVNFKSDKYNLTPFHSASQIANNTMKSDIVRTLETKLSNVHLSKIGSTASQSTTAKNVELRGSTPILNGCEDDLDNPFNSLPKNLQELSRTISSMGFPLPRVARACKLLGDDHKKVTNYWNNKLVMICINGSIMIYGFSASGEGP